MAERPPPAETSLPDSPASALVGFSFSRRLLLRGLEWWVMNTSAGLTAIVGWSETAPLDESAPELAAAGEADALEGEAAPQVLLATELPADDESGTEPAAAGAPESEAANRLPRDWDFMPSPERLMVPAATGAAADDSGGLCASPPATPLW